MPVHAVHAVHAIHVQWVYTAKSLLLQQ